MLFGRFEIGSGNVEVFAAKVDLINCSHVCTVYNWLWFWADSNEQRTMSSRLQWAAWIEMSSGKFAKTQVIATCRLVISKISAAHTIWVPVECMRLRPMSVHVAQFHRTHSPLPLEANHWCRLRASAYVCNGTSEQLIARSVYKKKRSERTIANAKQQLPWAMPLLVFWTATTFAASGVFTTHRRR